MKNLKDGDFKNKRVLVRCDFNVALDEKGGVADDFRVVKTLPTLKSLIKSGAIVAIISHIENEDGAVSLRPVARHLEMLLGRPVKFLRDCVGAKTKKKSRKPARARFFFWKICVFTKKKKKMTPDFAASLPKTAIAMSMKRFLVATETMLQSSDCRRFCRLSRDCCFGGKSKICKKYSKIRRTPLW